MCKWLEEVLFHWQSVNTDFFPGLQCHDSLSTSLNPTIGKNSSHLPNPTHAKLSLWKANPDTSYLSTP